MSRESLSIQEAWSLLVNWLTVLSIVVVIVAGILVYLSATR